MVNPFLNLLDSGEAPFSWNPSSHNNSSLLKTPEKGVKMVIKGSEKSSSCKKPITSVRLLIMALAC